jgi:hypothetical protein
MRRAPLAIFLTAATLLTAGTASAFSLSDWFHWGKRKPQSEAVMPVGGTPRARPPVGQEPCNANSCPQGSHCNEQTGKCEAFQEGCANDGYCDVDQRCSDDHDCYSPAYFIPYCDLWADKVEWIEASGAADRYRPAHYRVTVAWLISGNPERATLQTYKTKSASFDEYEVLDHTRLSGKTVVDALSDETTVALRADGKNSVCITTYTLRPEKLPGAALKCRLSLNPTAPGLDFNWQVDGPAFLPNSLPLIRLGGPNGAISTVFSSNDQYGSKHFDSIDWSQVNLYAATTDAGIDSDSACSITASPP